jgi:hypothetical protein
MDAKSVSGTAARWLALTAGVAAGAYGTYVALTWARYGKASRGRPDEQDELLDRFMPAFDIAERHHIPMSAPAELTLAAAKQVSLWSTPAIRAIFRGRELLLGATPGPEPSHDGLLGEALAMGWGVLADVPGREIVVGAVTKPWEADVTFRALPPETFAAFDEPDYVKIAWTLRADPMDDDRSIFRTETRAIATDDSARRKFRLYWSCLSPGIILIRWLLLAPMRRAAERAARSSKAARSTVQNQGVSV